MSACKADLRRRAMVSYSDDSFSQRTVEQVEGLAAALVLGTLPAETMDEFARLVDSEFESEGKSPR